ARRPHRPRGEGPAARGARGGRDPRGRVAPGRRPRPRRRAPALPRRDPPHPRPLARGGARARRALARARGPAGGVAPRHGQPPPGRDDRARLEREGFAPSPKLIAQRLDVREKEVVEMEQRLAARDVSVDAPVGEDEDATLLDFLPSREHTAEAVADKEYHRLIRETANEF